MESGAMLLLRVVGLLMVAGLPWVTFAGDETRVAVVDVSTVFKNYKKVYDVQRAIDASFEQESRKLLEDTRELQKKVREVEQMRRDAPEPNEFVFEQMIAVQRREFALRKRQQAFEQKRGKRYLAEMRDVLNEIRAAIEKAAVRGKYQLVLRSPDASDPVVGDETAPGNKENPNEEIIREMLQPKHTLDLVIRFKRNPVLFGSPLVDLTQEVLKDLNDEYAKRAGTAPAKE